MPLTVPTLSLQTGSLYASGADSTFDGTGGPWGFSPWTSQFGGIVSSAGLAAEPFADTVYAVAAGDEVIFVIAVQNIATGASAFDVQVQGVMPTGFVIPADGANISVTDGAGTDLAISGDLFGPAGLLIVPPLAAYDADSGRNVALVTYTLQAGPATPGPAAQLPSTAAILHVAAIPGGADIPTARPAAVTTMVVTAAPAPVVAGETDTTAVAKGQTIAFDVTFTLPAGTVQGLRLDTALPTGSSMLDMLSASVTGIGGGLVLGTPQIGQDGSIDFGTVVSTVGAGAPADRTIAIRVVVRADGSSSGQALMETMLSTAPPAGSTTRWSTTAVSSVGVVVPPTPVQLSGFWTAQRATTTMTIHPLAAMQIGTDFPGQTGTLAVTLGDGSLGRLSGATIGSLDATGTTFVATGSIAALQDAAQHLEFTPSAAGVEQFGVTLVDASGGVAQDASAAVTITPSVDTGHLAQHFASAPATSFITARADGQQTLAVGETYQGPVSYLQAQYIYDGSDAVAIAAKTPNVFVKNFIGSAAVALLSGQNVVDAGSGSNFLVGGTGTDVFFLDGRSNIVTWNTIVGFHTGDIVTLWGFDPATSHYWWEDNVGAVGYTGRTLRSDLQGHGQITASLTFAGADKAQTDGFALTTGQVAGIDYMTIFAL